MAEKAKEEGNNCMKTEKYVEAMMHYTEAIKIDPSLSAAYSNRSLAFLKMQQYYLALEDAKVAVKLDPKWAKGYYRMGEVQFQAELYEDALASYKQALNLCPSDEKLQEAVARAKSHLSSQFKAERRMPLFGVVLGMLAGVFIVAADQIVAKNPVLQHILVQALTVVAISGLFYAGATAYVFYLRSQRKGLLEQPIDLLGEERRAPSSPSSGSTGDAPSAGGGDTAGKPRKRASVASAKHKQRQAANS